MGKSNISTKGGVNINGIIEQYLVNTENINAGDFVEYVNEKIGRDTSFNTRNNQPNISHSIIFKQSVYCIWLRK